jgi:hypothetical protein
MDNSRLVIGIIQESGNSSPKLPEIVVTAAMIEAGLGALREHHYAEDTLYMLECVFRAMAYASPSVSVRELFESLESVSIGGLKPLNLR